MLLFIGSYIELRRGVTDILGSIFGGEITRITGRKSWSASSGFDYPVSEVSFTEKYMDEGRRTKKVADDKGTKCLCRRTNLYQHLGLLAAEGLKHDSKLNQR